MKGGTRNGWLTVYRSAVSPHGVPGFHQLAGLEDHFGYIDHTCNPDLEDITTSYIQAGDIFFVAQIAK
jgi:hypothetical protein